MSGYELSTPRAALGLAAVAMAAITMGALVLLPATLEFVSVDPYTLAAAGTATKAPRQVAITTARIGECEAVDREQDGRAAVVRLSGRQDSPGRAAN